MYEPKRGYPTVVPTVLYDDPVAIAGGLTDVLGVREVVRATLPGGWVGHVELERTISSSCWAVAVASWRTPRV